MILRRLSKHLLTQDWAAAVIDFIIVVAGIFVGLQVDSWNETRIDLPRGFMDGKLSIEPITMDINSLENLVFKMPVPY